MFEKIIHRYFQYIFISQRKKNRYNAQIIGLYIGYYNIICIKLIIYLHLLHLAYTIILYCFLLRSKNKQEMLLYYHNLDSKVTDLEKRTEVLQRKYVVSKDNNIVESEELRKILYDHMYTYLCYRGSVFQGANILVSVSEPVT